MDFNYCCYTSSSRQAAAAVNAAAVTGADAAAAAVHTLSAVAFTQRNWIDRKGALIRCGCKQDPQVKRDLELLLFNTREQLLMWRAAADC